MTQIISTATESEVSESFVRESRNSTDERISIAPARTTETEKPVEEIVLGEFTLNLRRRLLLKNGQKIELTQVEFQIIEYFFTHPDEALDRTDILSRVWGDSYVGEEKIVDVNIRRLRMKIEDEPSAPKRLVTVWGMGYKWATE